MTTQLARWGNSLAIRIPKPLAAQLNLREETEVTLSVTDGKIVITPAQNKYALESLLEGITEENLHGETDTGLPAGAEGW